MAKANKDKKPESSAEKSPLANMMSFEQMRAEAKRRAKARKNNLKKGN